MGGINSLSGLNSVPVDYRPPAAPEPGAQPQQAAPEAQAPQRPPRASNVVQRLDVLLLGGAAIRLAMLLLQTPAAEDGGRMTVAADSRGVSYAVFAPDGSIEDADDDWEPLVRRLESSLSGSASAATVFWP